MEDFLKFIPIALWILYSIFGKSSKTKKQKPKSRPVAAPKQKKTTSIEDILRELSGEVKEVAKPVVEKANKPKPNKRKKLNISEKEYDFRPEYEIHADTGPSVEAVKDEIDEIRGKRPVISKGNIDLRQAIIYDAILNRPDY